MNRSPRAAAAAALCLLLLAGGSTAQQLALPPVRAPLSLPVAGPVRALQQRHATPLRPAPWNVGVDLSAAGAGGNSRYLLFTSGFQLRRKRAHGDQLQLDGQTRYGTNGDAIIARLYRGGLHYDGASDATWSPFVFLTAERDLFRKLELRAQGGAGATWAFERSPGGKLSLGAALLYDHQDVVGSEVRRTARLSWRFKGDHQLGSGVKLDNTSSYQPLWQQTGDYLASSVTTLTSKLTDHMALTVAYDFERNSTPPPAVLPDDELLNVGLKLTF